MDLWARTLGVVLLLIGLAACAEKTETLSAVTVNGQIMGTTYMVKVVEPPVGLTEEDLAAGVRVILDDVDETMSTYRPESELSRFNAASTTDWYPAPDTLVKVVREAMRIAESTGGAFDVTVGPLVNLWGFGPGEREYQVPALPQLEAVRKRVGFQFLQIRDQPPALRKLRADLYVDLSAVAKGFAVDGVAGYLERLEVASYMVEVGGELRVRGHNGQGNPWRIAVENPTPGSRSIHRVFTPGSGGIATSGDYRNFFEVDGRRYSHTIDPTTGRPIDHKLASVSVVHPSAMTADGLATAIMVMGPEKGLAFATETGLAVFMIVKDGDAFRALLTPAFADYLVGEN